MNRNPHASVTQLAREISVPRSTTYRLLDTLVGLGFVALSADGYALTREVRLLSDGFIDEAWIEPAWHEMVALSSNLVWPVSLLTHEGPSMVIRRTTHELSSMSIDYGMTGRRLPITETAAGRVYLAFCTEAERSLILSMPGAYSDEPTPIRQKMIEERLLKIGAQGFDTRVGGVVPKTGSFSVPVLIDGRVLCCLSIIFIASAMKPERAIATFEEPMKLAAARIVQSIANQASPGTTAKRRDRVRT